MAGIATAPETQSETVPGKSQDAQSAFPLRLWPVLAALVIGIGILAIDNHDGLPDFPAAWVILGSLLLGFLQPRAVWRYPLVISIVLIIGNAIQIVPWIAHTHVMQQAMPFWGAHDQYPPSLGNEALSIVPGVAAGYVGLWLRRGLEVLADLSR